MHNVSKRTKPEIVKCPSKIHSCCLQMIALMVRPGDMSPHSEKNPKPLPLVWLPLKATDQAFKKCF